VPESAWSKQSASLVEVQKQGPGFEAVVREILEWPGGKIVYDPSREAMTPWPSPGSAAAGRCQPRPAGRWP
jgi:hypothetical protein